LVVRASSGVTLSHSHALLFGQPLTQRNVVDVLRERGLLDACTNEAGLRALAAPGAPPLRVYCGFDPTADSLHLGNLLGILVLAWFQRCGHTPVALVGGATGRVGDPSGKSTERPVLDDETLERNTAGIAALLGRLLVGDAPGGGGGSPVVMNNIEWFGGLSLLDFLRDVGKHARVSVMLAKDSVKNRINRGDEADAGQQEGMSFTEFTYQLLQAHDFAHLYRSHGVAVQIGGSDQWGNITAGTDLIRRTAHSSAALPAAGDGAFGLTFPLLLRSDGKKFGKSEDGAVWLTAAKLSPYKLYQHLFATPDADVPTFLRRLTFLPLADIAALEASMTAPGYETNSAQRVLAAEVTRFVHGQDGLQQALRATEGLAPGSATQLDGPTLEALAGDVPSVTLGRSLVLSGSFTVAELAVASGMQPSKGAARRLIKGGGVYLNNAKVADEGAAVGAADAVDGKLLLLACGKKNKVLIRLSDTA
jgi:tyrosyl-tRNA synthetase